MILKSAALCKRGEFFSELARECNTSIAAGIHVEEEGRHYDAACLFDETGTLLGEYRKIHLWDKECEFLSVGQPFGDTV
ncbi:MAG: nitrilase-related carbon-nitrogen hydrolase [[Clostridium] scindens]